ncbi:hypothetical protein SAMN05216378_5835 [Paenibacillus catalpae]|uniref:Uncharacterized protein n=1 Tax=Paenibacillus catalpae TaxID=1045775 RepID=A0A1I2HH00_9BACL|nr:hypothetical protein [Paenibacillus catalpae]SFF29424.1 hypothetical protein SAMN05216378_5835 [Paenibacillus catalpae]
MAARIKPTLKSPSKGKGKVVKRAAQLAPQQSGPIFSRLTVVWVTDEGIPFNTTGFFARLYRGNTIVSTASFDRFGVVRFNNITTLTTAVFTIRIFRSADGALFRTRTIPSGVETFAVIG